MMVEVSLEGQNWLKKSQKKEELNQILLEDLGMIISIMIKF
jgi:hypothetical protein